MRLTPYLEHGRVAIVGIGNADNGDDGAGVEVVRRLSTCIPPRSDVLLLEGATAPENLTGTLRRFNPHTVLLVDAADFGEAGGAVAWIRVEDADGLSASTHTLPPTLLSRYLAHELGCSIRLLAIQPESLVYGDPLSDEVSTSIDEVVRLLQQAIVGDAPLLA